MADLQVTVHKVFTDKTAELQIKSQSYNGGQNKYLDIRKTYEKGGERMPTRKGVSLDAYDIGSVLEVLLEQRAEIEKEFGIDYLDFGFEPLEKPKPKTRKTPAKKIARSKKAAA